MSTYILNKKWDYFPIFLCKNPEYKGVKIIYAKQFEAELNLGKGAYEWYVTANKFGSNEEMRSRIDFKRRKVLK